MPEKHYNKLVRDKIPLIIQKQGRKPITEKIKSNKIFEHYLGEKLVEESKEYCESKQLEELIDIMEVIYSLLSLKGIDISDIEKMRITKKEERGGFEKKTLLLKVIE
ncbi:MAG: phosphoribosyl-ATP pyrophosphohydrolase [Asgard group archaeon]|nr:phosphoribosyl-ATP pyrophosphohydrolase [Asgard group archaeon]